MSIIEIEDLSLTYHNGKNSFLALSHINLSIKNGEFICIIGSSGCGKSTLLSVLEGLNKPTGGVVRIHGKPVRGAGTDRGIVFQHYSLFPWLTAKKNVIFGMKQSKRKYTKAELNNTAVSFLEKVGLEDAVDKYPGQLSGGMQQRVAIARALALNADILLMDEPFGAIDAKNRIELQELVSSLSQTERKTVVFVTHDIDEAILLADKIIFMSPKEIKKEIIVPLPRPRIRDELVKFPEYLSLRKQLVGLFYDQVANNIGNEEVLL